MASLDKGMYPFNMFFRISLFLQRPDIPALPAVKNRGSRKYLREPRYYFEIIVIFLPFSENRMEKYALVLILQPVKLVW